MVVTKSTPDDHEFLEPEEWESWGALMLLHRMVLRRLDSELQKNHHLAMTEFDVLITLYNAPSRRLRMSTLAERVLLSPAGATHLVTRLERDGLVRREVDPTDRRKWFAALTDQGDATLKSARRTHNAVLRETLFAVTTSTEQRTLRRLWQRLARRQANPLAPAGGDD